MSGPKHDLGILSPSEKLARASERDRATIQRLAEALKGLLKNEPMPFIGHKPGAFVILVTQDDIDDARAALREAGADDA